MKSLCHKSMFLTVLMVILTGCFLPTYNRNATENLNIQSNCSVVDACSREEFEEKYGAALRSELYDQKQKWGAIMEWIDQNETKHVAILLLYQDETVEESTLKGILWGIDGPRRGLPIPLEDLKDDILLNDEIPYMQEINPAMPNYPLPDVQDLPIHHDLIATGSCPSCQDNRYWYSITDTGVVTLRRKATPD